MAQQKQLPVLTDDRDRPFTRISPSILSADFANLARDCNAVLRDGADFLHVDIMVSAAAHAHLPKLRCCVYNLFHHARLRMVQADDVPSSCCNAQDGHMVPNLTIGAPVVKSLRKCTDAFLDCHLMVTDPGQWVEVRWQRLARLHLHFCVICRDVRG